MVIGVLSSSFPSFLYKTITFPPFPPVPQPLERRHTKAAGLLRRSHSAASLFSFPPKSNLRLYPNPSKATRHFTSSDCAALLLTW